MWVILNSVVPPLVTQVIPWLPSQSLGRGSSALCTFQPGLGRRISDWHKGNPPTPSSSSSFFLGRPSLPDEREAVAWDWVFLVLFCSARAEGEGRRWTGKQIGLSPLPSWLPGDYAAPPPPPWGSAQEPV